MGIISSAIKENHPGISWVVCADFLYGAYISMGDFRISLFTQLPGPGDCATYFFPHACLRYSADQGRRPSLADPH